MIKIICLLTIFICTSFVGFCFCSHFKRRKDLFEEMVYVVEQIKEEISFKKTYFEEILSNLKLSREIESIKNNLQSEKNPFSEEEKEEITKFFNSLGSSDVDGEMEKLVQYKHKFQSRAERAGKFYEKNGKLSVKLGILLGVALFIAFI